MNGFWWFVLGFGTATALSIWWYRGTMKQRLDNLKKVVGDKVKEKL